MKEYSPKIVAIILILSAVCVEASDENYMLGSSWLFQLNGEELNLEFKAGLKKRESDSCYFSDAKEISISSSTFNPKEEFPLGVSYKIEGEIFKMDLFAGMCDAGIQLDGKINKGYIEGKIYSASFAGLKEIGKFKAHEVK